jgi:hypothetical protein
MVQFAESGTGAVIGPQGTPGFGVTTGKVKAYEGAGVLVRECFHPNRTVLGSPTKGHSPKRNDPRLFDAFEREFVTGSV